VLWPLGGFTVFGSSDEAVSDDLLIAVSGPLTHVFQGGFWVGIYALLEHGDMSGFSTSIDLIQLSNGGAVEFISILSSQAALINAGLFICNLAIPAYPLDGGRILAALLVMGDFSLGTTARITSVMGAFIGLLMLFIGVYWYVSQTTAGSLFLAIIALFVVHSGLQLWKAAVMNRLHEHPLFQLSCYRSRGGSRRPLTISSDASRSPPRVPTNSARSINIV
jgi:Zn-dependent protease